MSAAASLISQSKQKVAKQPTNKPTNQRTNHSPLTTRLKLAGGYVVDRRVGNTGGLGALFGILTAIGVKVPKPGSLGFKIATAVQAITGWFAKLFGGKE